MERLSSKTAWYDQLTPVMDVPSALRRLGNDRDLFDQITVIYLEDAPKLLQSAQTASENADAASLRRAAHSLKGLTATLSAEQAVAAAFRVEQLAGAGDLERAGEAMQSLAARLSEVNAALELYLRSIGRRRDG